MPLSKRWVLAPRKGPIQGLPVEEDFEVLEDHTPELGPGEILVRALFFSVDPIIRCQSNKPWCSCSFNNRVKKLLWGCFDSWRWPLLSIIVVAVKAVMADERLL
jgi:N-terminal domain of oxidoreductase